MQRADVARNWKDGSDDEFVNRKWKLFVGLDPVLAEVRRTQSEIDDDRFFMLDNVVERRELRCIPR